jgi:kumamolisin
MRGVVLSMVLAGAGIAAFAACHVTLTSPPPAPIEPLILPASLYADIGVADPQLPFRALIALPPRDPAGLETTIDGLYKPGSPTFRQYLHADDVKGRFTPTDDSLNAVKSWLTSHGFQVPYSATNNLLLQFTGSIGAFNTAFGTSIHLYSKVQDAGDNSSNNTGARFGPVTSVILPPEIASIAIGVLTIDPAASTADLPKDLDKDAGPPPLDDGVVTPERIREQYNVPPDLDVGKDQTIGIVTGYGYKLTDIHTFWDTYQIERSDPDLVVIGDATASRNLESSIDVQWAGSIARGAKIKVYQGPDNSDTALLFAFNEAVARAEVSVITDSFSGRENSISKDVAREYDVSAQLAALVGITIVAATGDTKFVDVPASCPHITAVGGTKIGLNGAEVVWNFAGAGPSKVFPAPPWAPIMGPNRVVPDVALNAGTPLRIVNFSTWDHAMGTSFASPLFGAMLTIANAARAQQGKPAIGFLTSTLYTNQAVQGTFRDVVAGQTSSQSAKPGWDDASGWGAPDLGALIKAIP